MSSNDPTMTANGPSQKHSSRSNSSPAATTTKNPSIDSDTKHLPPRLIGTGLSGVPRLPTPGNPSVSVCANNSNNSSRDTSPVRLTSRVLSTHNHHTAATHRSLSRAKNSSSPSPSRGTSGTGPTSTPTTTVSSTLSPATVQKAFAQLGKPDLQRSPVLDVSDPERASMPPPRTSRRRTSIGNGSRSPSLGSTTSRRTETTASESLANISTKRTSVSPEEGRISPSKAAYDDHEASARRPSGRTATQPGTTLETVQEFSVPSTPIALAEGSLAGNLPIKGIDTNQQVVESGSESGGNKSSGSKEGNEARRSSIKARPTDAILPQKSFTSLKSGRGKPSDGSVRNMIVETETVSSIPQLSLGVGAGGSSRNDQGGTVRLKPSVETIRPKKERKKASRKLVNPPGTASSKADIFEAKVASAIDDADVSDSDETFVYESNPPEPLPNRHRYHSRTPSATSMASQAEQFTNRPRLSGKDGSGITVKRSMKFTNNHHANVDNDSGDMDQRSASGRIETSVHSGRHHHIGRHGRGGAHASLFDSDSPFPQSQQQPRSPRHYISNSFHQNRRGNTPRTHPNYRTIGGPKSMSDEYLDDFDADGADDERTPLVSSARLSRNRNGRRPGSASLRQMEFLEHRQRNRLSTYGGCFLAVFLIFMLICGVATFLAALMRPLAEVQITRLSNVLASEQELILDVHVSAINPNIFPISIETMDVDIFARSRYVGSDKFWHDHGPHPGDFPRVERSKFRAHLAQRARLPARDESNSFFSDMNSSDGVDQGTDPIPSPDDPSSDVGKMRLGRVFRFDSPVLLDPSPWRRHSSESVGEIRLLKPGNKTEEGGTERWERVLQHPFELDVRGVFKYSLPLTSSVRSALISARIQVLPDDGSDHGNDGDGSDKEGNVLFPGASGNEDVRMDFQ